ncbi:hypothetical protein IQ260_04425 [Leptolyngbya cf. ectocarpi LEGE 11479]|uniref:DUF2281 domain-containing protein n=1 Tax=Leptolyngbya cf. ectocarpi LEGE 11479 TaxID=1828722 RepID=A0A928ZQW9_LEPEC|nr:hypothetical protein [Leptolyngbya ectocarpi]MBE9065893.1 hypothetical protein [Leptolyngbya cf. ectocarpi LEGE 11479]
MNSVEKVRHDLIQIIQTLPEQWLREIFQFVEFLRYRANSTENVLADQEPVAENHSFAYERLVETGFIGCAEAEPDLSVNYKSYLSDTLNAKHGDH